MIKLRASKLIVKLVDSEQEKAFLDENHKHGYVPSDYAIGLYNNNNELVQIETFGKPRIEMQANKILHDWELLRECSKKDYQIYGGKSKLLKYFEINKKPLNILSYCSLSDGFDGHSYSACGFKLENVTQDYWYEYNGEIIQRYRMQKNANKRAKGIKEPIQITLEKYGKKYDPNMTEKENAKNAGFITVKGNGQQVWTKRNSDFIGYIYKITNRNTGKVYIGKHTLFANGKLLKVDYWGSGIYITNAIKSEGKKAFKREALYWTDNDEDLCNAEEVLINEYAEKVGKENMYNIDFNGASSKRSYDKKAISEKISESKRGTIPWNKGKKGAQVAWNKDLYGYHTKPHSEATKIKISESNKKIWNDTKRAEMSNKMKGNKNAKCYSFWKCIETGEVKSTTDWLKDGYKVHRKYYRGFHFEKA